MKTILKLSVIKILICNLLFTLKFFGSDRLVNKNINFFNKIEFLDAQEFDLYKNELKKNIKIYKEYKKIFLQFIVFEKKIFFLKAFFNFISLGAAFKEYSFNEFINHFKEKIIKKMKEDFESKIDYFFCAIISFKEQLKYCISTIDSKFFLNNKELVDKDYENFMQCDKCIFDYEVGNKDLIGFFNNKFSEFDEKELSKKKKELECFLDKCYFKKYLKDYVEAKFKDIIEFFLKTDELLERLKLYKEGVAKIGNQTAQHCIQVNFKKNEVKMKDKNLVYKK